MHSLSGQVLYNSNLPSKYKTDTPLTVWVVNNEEYKLAVLALREARNKVRSKKGYKEKLSNKVLIPPKLTVLLITIFIFFAVLISGGVLD